MVALCAREGVAVVPQGGNTGLVGGSVPTGDAARDRARARAHEPHPQPRPRSTIRSTVEAGCVLAAVQAAAADAGRLFPLSLAAEGSCQIGGNLSTNAGGVNVLRYGNAREQVLGLEVVLPDGRVWDGLRGLRKDNTGYDLKQLFLGAEGTLGVITAAVLRLYPKPTASATAWIALASPRAGGRAARGAARPRRRSHFRFRAGVAHLPGSRARARAGCSRSAAARRTPGTCSPSSATAAPPRTCTSGSRQRSTVTKPCSRKAASRRARSGACARAFRRRSSATSSTTSRSRYHASPSSSSIADAGLTTAPSPRRRSSASATSATATCTTTSARPRSSRSATR